MLELWYKALHSTYGIIVSVPEGKFDLARQKLYKVRKASGDEDLKGIAVAQSPENMKDIWLVKRKPGNGSAK